MQNLLFGLLTGAILAVATSGFALIRNTERFLHIAHGQFMALGALIALSLTQLVGPLIAFPAAVLVTAGLGVLCGKVFFDPIKHQGANVMLFTSVGLAFLVYAAMTAIFGTQIKTFPVELGTARKFGPIAVAPGELILLLVAAIIAIGLWILLAKTAVGRSIRAVSSNRELAQIRGVQINRISSVVWALSSGLAAIAGIMLGILGSVSTEAGWTYILLVLAAAVLGGVSNILGVVAAAMLLGLVMDLSALVVDTAFRPVIAFVLLIGVLLVRPQGIFSFQARKEAIA
ncbi:branched-chain amino acid ABC transporter permease [Rhodococcus sp. NPDC057529]|uniref:branched-chain amino acid ABC transporter permease n=1 Tax=Rhodococcus sp. NPDC057529 TaxID=3346158 RepID=UPI00366E4F7C